MSEATGYEVDYHAWANQQAALLRAGRLEALDIDHIAEELESMGRSEKRELISRLTVLLTHLLKWRFQARLRGRSWRISVLRQRDDLADHLNENPSLRGDLDELTKSAYRKARIEAERETRLPGSTFPATCPWSWTQIMDQAFWPQE